MGKKVYGYWKCSTCGRADIRSDTRHCPSCGTACAEGTKFYMKEDVVEYIEGDDIKKYSGKPDWVCSYCSTLNSTNSETCSNCGASYAESEANYFTVRKPTDDVDTIQAFSMEHHERTHNGNLSFDDTSEIDDISEEISMGNKSSSIWENMGKKINSAGNAVDAIRQNILKYGAIGVGCLALIALIVWLLIPKMQTLNIQGFSWERRIDIEEPYLSFESGWTLPAEAELRYTREEEYDREAVIDGYETKERTVRDYVKVGETEYKTYEDNGDGSFDEVVHTKDVYDYVSREETYTVAITHYEPIMRTKYYYDIERWRVKDKVTTQGSDREPYWGEVVLVDRERKGSAYETYYVTAVNVKKDKVGTYVIGFDLWNKLPESGFVKVKVGVGNYITEIVQDDES